MKILVTVKRIPDPDESLKFAAGGLDYSASKWVPNAFDEYAVETALRLAEVVGDVEPPRVELQRRGVDRTRRHRRRGRAGAEGLPAW